MEIIFFIWKTKEIFLFDESLDLSRLYLEQINAEENGQSVQQTWALFPFSFQKVHSFYIKASELRLSLDVYWQKIGRTILGEKIDNIFMPSQFFQQLRIIYHILFKAIKLKKFNCYRSINNAKTSTTSLLITQPYSSRMLIQGAVCRLLFNGTSVQ